jgi:hypothetical protein
MLLKSRRGD